MTKKVKVKLGDCPASFPAIKCPFKTNKGLDSDISAVFKYRTRKEYGAFIGEMMGQDVTEFPRTEDGQIDFASLAATATGKDAEYLLNALDSWDMEDPLTAKVLEQLANEQPAAVVSLKQAYAAACNEGRLGN